MSTNEKSLIDRAIESRNAKVLLDKHFKVTSVDALNRMLFVGVLLGSARLVCCAASKGADLNLPQIGNDTALYFAIKSGHKNLAGFIATHEDVDVDADDGKALQIAYQSGDESMMNVLLYAGADPVVAGIPDRYHRSPDEIVLDVVNSLAT